MRYLIALVFLGACGWSCAAFGYEESVYQEKTYGLVVDAYDWNSAEDLAQLYNGHLATIGGQNSMEVFLLKNWLCSNFSGLTECAWIGNYYSPSDGWKWLGSYPYLYSSFPPGYPRAGFDENGCDYAMLRLSDGFKLDAYPQNIEWPTIGIYELDHSGATPLSMSLPCYAKVAADQNFWDDDTGTNSASVSYYEELGEPEFPEFIDGSAEIAASAGAWGGRIESHLAMAGDRNGTAETCLTDGGTFQIGTLGDITEGDALSLMIDANVLGDDADWSFALLRDDDILLSIDSETETEILVYAGETLTVQFSHSLTTFSGSSSVAVNFWTEPVPEPASLVLLIVAGLCGLACVRRRYSKR